MTNAIVRLRQEAKQTAEQTVQVVCSDHVRYQLVVSAGGWPTGLRRHPLLDILDEVWLPLQRRLA